MVADLLTDASHAVAGFGEPLVDPFLERPGGGVAVLVESPLGARDLPGVCACATVLAGHLLTFVGNSESRRERLFSQYQQKYQQIGRLGADENKR